MFILNNFNFNQISLPSPVDFLVEQQFTGNPDQQIVELFQRFTSPAIEISKLTSSSLA